MATLTQIEANRRNSLLSTGPRTEAGKAASRLNALKSGIYTDSITLPGEDPAALAQLTAEYFDRFQPATPEERDLGDTLVHCVWMLRRLRRTEPELFLVVETRYQDSVFYQNAGSQYGYIYDRLSAELARLQTRINSFDRAYHRALTKLTKLQKARRETESTPQPEPSQPEIGFVPQNDCSAACEPIPDPRPQISIPDPGFPRATLIGRRPPVLTRAATGLPSK